MITGETAPVIAATGVPAAQGGSLLLRLDRRGLLDRRDLSDPDHLVPPLRLEVPAGRGVLARPSRLVLPVDLAPLLRPEALGGREALAPPWRLAVREDLVLLFRPEGLVNSLREVRYQGTL